MDNRQEAAGGGFVVLPTTGGQGCVVRRSQVVGARANGPDGGAIVYTAAGPSNHSKRTSHPTKKISPSKSLWKMRQDFKTIGI
jgi:hypothetical protein